MPGKQTNINQRIRPGSVSVETSLTEDPAVRDARLKKEDEDAASKRRIEEAKEMQKIEDAKQLANWQIKKDIILFSLTIVSVLIVGLFCGLIIVNKNSAAEEKTFAMSFITLIVGALVGYYTGGKISK